MAELATIARPYAEALFKSTRGGDTAAVSGWLDELAVIAADPQLARFADDPKVDAEQVFRLIVGVAPRVLPDAARNFLRVVVDNARLAALPDMARQYRALANGDTGTADAVVHSAYPIDEATLGQLQQALQRRFGRPLQLHVEHDPALIGGVRVVVGDEVLDTSVRARLEQMKQALAA